MSALFLKILNMSLNASWLILAVVIVRVFLKKSPKWVSCLLWGLVAFRLICPFTIHSMLSLLPSDEVVPSNIMMQQNPRIYSGVRLFDNTVNPIVESAFTPEAGYGVNPLQVFIAIAWIVWLLGFVAMLVYVLVSCLLLRRRVSASVRLSEGIYECDEVSSPFILGIFRPVIYVPSGMDPETLEYVTAHERAHLKRNDHLWKPLGFFLLSVYWFNPFSWLAYVLLCRDIEAACDEKVIHDKDMQYMAAYSQALLDCSVRRRVIAACPLAFGETDVKGRVKGILNYKKPAFWIIIASVAACIVVAVCFITAPGRNNDVPDENAANAVAASVSEVTEDQPVTGESSGEEYIVVDPLSTHEVYSGQIYRYSGNDPDKEFWMGFCISLYDDGKYTWYEDLTSSYLGFGDYTIEDDVLTLIDDTSAGCDKRVNRFRMDGDKLYYIADGSDNFRMHTLKDGEAFIMDDPAYLYGEADYLKGGYIYVAFPGVVTAARYEDGVGYYLEIKDEFGAVSGFSGLYQIYVDEGDEVKVGDKMAININIPFAQASEFFESEFCSPTDSFFISRPFDPNDHPETDIPGAEGTPVYAVCDAEVSATGFTESSGNYIVLTREYEGHTISVIYSHMEDISVDEGESVNAGDTVGTLGNTGNSTGPHLGIQLVVDECPIDIADYIQ